MTFTCPICNNTVKSSDYLNKFFKDDILTNKCAHLVTHYRFNHVKYYLSTLHSHYCTDTDEWKFIINNRAKRKLMEAMVKKSIWFEIEGFRKLQDNDQDTIDKMNLILSTHGKRMRVSKKSTQ